MVALSSFKPPGVRSTAAGSLASGFGGARPPLDAHTVTPTVWTECTPVGPSRHRPPKAWSVGGYTLVRGSLRVSRLYGGRLRDEDCVGGERPPPALASPATQRCGSPHLDVALPMRGCPLEWLAMECSTKESQDHPVVPARRGAAIKGPRGACNMAGRASFVREGLCLNIASTEAGSGRR